MKVPSRWSVGGASTAHVKGPSPEHEALMVGDAREAGTAPREWHLPPTGHVSGPGSLHQGPALPRLRSPHGFARQKGSRSSFAPTRSLWEELRLRSREKKVAQCLPCETAARAKLGPPDSVHHVHARQLHSRPEVLGEELLRREEPSEPSTPGRFPSSGLGKGAVTLCGPYSLRGQQRLGCSRASGDTARWLVSTVSCVSSDPQASETGTHGSPPASDGRAACGMGLNGPKAQDVT